MIEQDKFLEAMEEIKTIAYSQQNKMTMDEVKKYLCDMGLGDEQMEAVLHYLGTAGISVEGYKYVPSVADLAAQSSDDSKPDEEMHEEGGIESMVKATEGNAQKASETLEDLAARNRKLYQDEVGVIEKLGAEQEMEIIELMMAGDKNARDRFAENRLSQVIRLADKYSELDSVKSGTVNYDDVIAEGNMGLLVGISVIEENAANYHKKNGSIDMAAVDGTLYIEITNAIETMIDITTERNDLESAMLAKTNLLNEAAKYMTEEIGRVPTREELSEYTKISLEEIKSIMGLSDESILH